MSLGARGATCQSPAEGELASPVKAARFQADHRHGGGPSPRPDASSRTLLGLCTKPRAGPVRACLLEGSFCLLE